MIRLFLANTLLISALVFGLSCCKNISGLENSVLEDTTQVVVRKPNIYIRAKIPPLNCDLSSHKAAPLSNLSRNTEGAGIFS